jgi:DNA adenine methylase
VQHHVDAVVGEIEFVLNARQNLIDFKEQKGLTEIQRAARWFVRNRISFGGNGDSFGCQGARASRRHALDALLDLNGRLDRVIIEAVPYQQCLDIYDRKETLFFIDPPYIGANVKAYAGWKIEQMRELRSVIEKLKGRWILTVDDSAGTRSVFAGFKLRKIVTVNALNQRLQPNNRKQAMRELLITRT